MYLFRSKDPINYDQWCQLVDDSIYLMSLHELENLPNKIYDYAILRVNGRNYGSVDLKSKEGYLFLDIKYKELETTHHAIMNIAEAIDAQFYIKTNILFDPKKHLPIPKVKLNKTQKYFETSNLEQIRWLAIREIDFVSISKKLNFKSLKDDQLTELLVLKGIVCSAPYKGWTFIIGDNLPEFMGYESEKFATTGTSDFCKIIQVLSKTFVEVQYFEHYDKSNITAYFKANNGKLNFGYWQSETEEFTKGRVPKEIKKLHPSTAHEVASVWSIDPLDFIYIKKFADEKARLVVRK